MSDLADLRPGRRLLPAPWALPAPRPAEHQLLARRLGLACLTAAVFLSPYAAWRLSAVFVTASDMCFMAGMGLLVLSGIMPARPLGGIAMPWLLSVTLMLLGLFVGSLASADPLPWVTAAFQYAFAYVGLPAFLILYGGGQSLRLARASIAGVFVLEAFGAVMYFLYDGSHDDLAFLARDFVSGARRLGSFTSEANWNGAIITMAFPLALYLRVTGAIRAWQMILVAAAFILGLVLTASVSAIIGSVAALIVFAVVGRVGPSRKACLALVAVAAVLASSDFGMPRAFQARVAPALENADIEEAGTFAGRKDLIIEAWRFVEDHSLIGMGTDQYRRISPLGAPVHNMFLLLWAEGGLASLLGWLAMMAIPTWACLAVWPVDRLRAAVGLSVLMGFLAFSVATPHMYARIWVVPAAVAMALVFETPLPASPRRRRAW